MNYLKISLLCFLLAGLWSCKQKTEAEMPDSSVFTFIVTGAENGRIKSTTGSVKATCEGNRTLLTFAEQLEGRTDDDDLLLGELIFGVQKSDSTGAFVLNGISNERKPKEVGIVALLNTLTFDELAAQYIMNEKRYDDVKTGKVTFTKWSDKVGEFIMGSLVVTLGSAEDEVKIEGTFAVKLQGGDEVCAKE